MNVHATLNALSLLEQQQKKAIEITLKVPA